MPEFDFDSLPDLSGEVPQPSALQNLSLEDLPELAPEAQEVAVAPPAAANFSLENLPELAPDSPVGIPAGLQLTDSTAEDVPQFDQAGNVVIPEIDEAVAAARLSERYLHDQAAKPIFDRIGLFTEALLVKGPLDAVDVQLERLGNYLQNPIEQDPELRAIQRVTNPLGNAIAENVANLNLLTNDAIAEFGRELKAKATEDYVNRARSVQGDIDDPWDEMIVGAGQSIGLTVGAAAISAATGSPLPGLAMFSYAAGSQAEMMARMEGHDERRAEFYGTLNGIVEGATEAIPFGALLKKTGVMKKLAEFLVKDLGGELAATTMDRVLQTVVLNKEFSVEDFKREMAITAGSTLLAAPFSVGGAGAVNRVMEVTQAYTELNERTRRESITGKLELEYKNLRDMATRELEALGKISPDDEILVFHGSPAQDIKAFQQKYIPDEKYDGGVADAWGVYLSDRAEYSAQERYTVKADPLGEDTAPPPAGKVYEVRISKNAPLLEWDKPLIAQAPKVRDALKAAGVTLDDRTGKAFYQELERQKFLGKPGSARKTSKLIASWGIEGTVMTRRNKFGQHKVYAIFDQTSPKIIKLGRQQSLFEETKAKLENFNQVREEFANNPPPLKLRERWTNFQAATQLSNDQVYKTFKEGVKFNQFMRLFASLEDLARVPENQNFGPLQDYLKVTHARHEAWGAWTSLAAQKADSWQQLAKDPKKEAAINQFYELAHRRSLEEQRYLDEGALQELYRQHPVQGLDASDVKFLSQVWDDYQSAFSALEEQLHRKIEWELGEGRESQIQDLQKQVSKTFEALKKQNYMPKYWFGNEVVLVRLGDEVIARHTFRNAGQAKEGLEKLKETYDPKVYKFHQTVVADEGGGRRGFEGVPDRFLEDLADVLDWGEGERAIAEGMQVAQKPIMNIGTRFQQADTPLGWEGDALRAYTTFFASFGNRYASLGHDHLLQRAIDAAVPPITSPEGRQRQQLTDWMRRHRDYLRNPQNELQGLRSLGFNFYIGAVPAAAALNLSQIPLFTFPMLSQDFNEVDATRALAKAISQRFGDFKALTLPGGRVLGKPSGYAETGYNREQLDLIQIAEKIVLDEGQGMVLGAISQENALQKISGGGLGGGKRFNRGVRKTLDGMSYMFSATEGFNRAITLTAAYDLARGSGMGIPEAQEYAIAMVRKSQGEYARFNRPELFRGKKSPLFLFMHYLTQMMYNFGNDPSRWRLLLMTFTLAGATGLPFAEDLLDLVNGAITTLGKYAGVKDPKTDLQRDAKEFIEDLWDDPDVPLLSTLRELTGIEGKTLAKLLQHGLASQIPNPLDGGKTRLDMSGSMGFGDVVPFTDLLNRSTDFEHAVTNVTRDGGGAVLGMPLNFIQAAMEHSEHHDWYRTIEKVSPTQIRNITRMMKWGLRGEERDRGGAAIAKFDTFEEAYQNRTPQGLAPTIMQGLGFQPTEVVEAKEKKFAFNETLAYYNSWRTSAMVRMKRAFEANDSKAIAEAMKAIQAYNQAVPDPTLRIGAGLRESLRASSKAQTLREIGTTPGRPGRLLAGDLLGEDGRTVDFRTPGSPQ